MASSSVTFLVPAYNEERRLGETLARLRAYAEAQPYDATIVVVDDGSSDATAAVARDAGVTLIEHEHNRGKGAAVRTGALAVEGEAIVTIDADLAMPPEEIAKLLAALDDGADLAAGSRIRPDGGDMRASQPAWRRLGGRVFAVFRRRLLLADIQDTQCGFKAYRRDAARAIFGRQRLDGWAFDAEVLYLAQKLGLTIKQVPIEWHHVEGSSFRLGLGTARREVTDLLRIRWMHRGVRPEA